jgi:subtilisin family serine protease
VQPNYLFALSDGALASSSVAVTAGDPAQYTLAKLRLPEAHAVAKGDGVIVAVIDSSIDGAHPELNGAIAGRFDVLRGPEAPDAHGTGIAGAISARARLLGVAPAARLLAVRAFGGAESTTFNVISGIDWAAANGARILNMSFAGPRDPLLGRELAGANRKGIVLVAAGGNAGPDSPPLYPAAEPAVIAVTATDAEDNVFAASNRGSHIAVAAPGTNILHAAPNATYRFSSGTSLAAAHISGIAALLLERQPDLTPEAVRNILFSTAIDLGPKGHDDQFGAGRADAYRAVSSIQRNIAGATAANP